MQPSGRWPRRSRFWWIVEAIRSFAAKKEAERTGASAKRTGRSVAPVRGPTPSAPIVRGPAPHRLQPDERKFEEHLTAEEGRHRHAPMTAIRAFQGQFHL
jgi:hypothetical protein